MRAYVKLQSHGFSAWREHLDGLSFSRYEIYIPLTFFSQWKVKVLAYFSLLYVQWTMFDLITYAKWKALCDYNHPHIYILREALLADWSEPYTSNVTALVYIYISERQAYMGVINLNESEK